LDFTTCITIYRNRNRISEYGSCIKRSRSLILPVSCNPRSRSFDSRKSGGKLDCKLAATRSPLQQSEIYNSGYYPTYYSTHEDLPLEHITFGSHDPSLSLRLPCRLRIVQACCTLVLLESGLATSSTGVWFSD